MPVDAPAVPRPPTVRRVAAWPVRVDALASTGSVAVPTATDSARECSRAVGRVGERALAVVQDDRQVDVYYSQWAGRTRRLARVLDGPGDSLEALAGADWEFRGRLPRGTVSRRVDALAIEAVYHLSVRGVRVYLPVWLGFSWPGERVSGGVLVRVETPGECRGLRATLRFLRGVLHEALGLDWFDQETARDLLALALRSHCSSDRIHTPGTPL
jgi:hypothetical protein